MALDTLEIFGDEFTNVAGIKATDDNDQIKVYIRPQGTKSISANGTGIDVTEYASVDVAVPSSTPTLQTITKSYTPTESQQTETITAGSGYDGIEEVDVTVGAISSTYVGSGITQRSSSDLTVSGATVTVPSGYYSAQASKSVASGTAGTPIATKGTVSNHSVSITPSVTNTTGYITGSTKTGTAVTVSASELVSGTYTVDSSGTKDVTNYASASVPAGTAGTPSASKGTVSNHSVSITPSVTNTTGWITGSTKTGTAVTVTASELASGNKAITQNGTDIDVVGYSTVSVDVPSSGGVTVTDVANTTGTTCVITTGSTPSEDIPLNTQLIDFTAVTNDYVVNSSGNVVAEQWYSVSDYTEIDPSMTFSYSGCYWFYIGFYDASKNTISALNMNSDGTQRPNDTNYCDGTLTPAKIPSNAKYVRITSTRNPDSTILSLIRTA